MQALRRGQRPLEELPGSNIAIVARGAQQARPVHRHRLPLNALQQFLAAFGQPVEIVHEIDQQEFPTELPGEGWLHPEIKPASAKRVLAMAFVIIDDGLVVELGRPHPEAVVGVGRGQQEPVVLQEASDQFIICRRRFAKYRLTRTGVKTARELGECAVLHQLPQMAVNRVRPLRHVLASIDLTGAQVCLELLEPCHAPQYRETRSICKYSQAGIPGPSSAIEITGLPSTCSFATTTCPPAWPCLIALSTRLAMASKIRSRSPVTSTSRSPTTVRRVPSCSAAASYSSTTSPATSTRFTVRKAPFRAWVSICAIRVSDENIRSTASRSAIVSPISAWSSSPMRRP